MLAKTPCKSILTCIKFGIINSCLETVQTSQIPCEAACPYSIPSRLFFASKVPAFELEKVLERRGLYKSDSARGVQAVVQQSHKQTDQLDAAQRAGFSSSFISVSIIKLIAYINTIAKLYLKRSL